MRRRSALSTLAGCLFLPTVAGSQVSQRRRQLRERADCEQNLLQCRPEIMAQLREERQTLRIGLSALGVAVVVCAGLLFLRSKRLNKASDKRR